MPRTAPVPNIPPIPGMEPVTIVEAGGAGGSGSDDDAGDAGKGNAGAGGDNGGNDAGGDDRSADSPNDVCTKEGEPFDVATGRVLSERSDFRIAGIFAFEWACAYSSGAYDVDAADLGYGWTHAYAWRIEVRRRSVVLWDEGGVPQEFDSVAPGTVRRGHFGRTLRRDPQGNYSIATTRDGLTRDFVSTEDPTLLQLARVRDDHGNAITLEYDQGRLARLVDTAGRIYQLRRDAAGRINAIEAKRGQHQGKWVSLVRYVYSPEGDLLEAIDPEGFKHSYTYREHVLESFTNRNGLKFHYRYDAERRCIETWGSYGVADPALSPGLPKKMTTGNGSRTIKGIFHRAADYTAGMTMVANTKSSRRYFPDAKGLMTKTVGEAGNVVTQRFDAYGERTLLVDGDEGVWRWTYDDEGRVAEHVDALGRVFRYRYGAHRDPLQVDAPNGGAWTFDRDARGRTTALVDPCGGRTSWRYDERGLVVAYEREGRAAVESRRDAAGQVVSMRHRGSEHTFEYDDFGRVIVVRGSDGAETRFQYNDRGDLIFKRDARGGVTQYQYDGQQNLTRVVAPDGSVRVATYGGYDWLVTMTDGSGMTTRLEYDWEGEIVAVVNEAGERATFEYDLNARVIGERTFDGRRLAYAYTRGGKLRTRIEANGQRTQYRYDAANNLVEQEDADGVVHRYVYDALDFVVEGVNDATKVFLQRDACGRVLREAIHVAGKVFEIQSEYATSGLRRLRVIDGHTVESVFDREGVLVSRSYDKQARKLDHDVMGRLVGWEHPNGALVKLTYDVVGALTRTEVLRPKASRVVDEYLTEMAGWERVVSRAYEYTPVNELARITDTYAGATEFAYDRGAQLLERATRSARERFSYDAIGDVTMEGRTTTFERGGKLVSAGGAELAYDDVGQLVSRKVSDGATTREWTYEWNGLGQLAAVVAPDRTRHTYVYDAFGRRLRKTSSTGEETLFAWDLNSLAAEVRTGRKGMPDERRVYVFEDADAMRPVAQWTSTSGWFDVVTSPLGVPTELVDDRGYVGWAATLKAFGEIESEQAGKTDTPLRLPGQYEDRETGLHYNRFRYYDPSLGRFISPDPLGVEGNLNAWAYARNPIGWSDPLGLENGAALESSMKGAGQGSCPSGFQAHHLVPEHLYNDPAYKGVLGKEDPHDPNNGIYLPSSKEAYDAQKGSGAPPQPPGKTIHCGKHSSAYNNYVKQELDKIKGMKPCKRKAALSALQSDLKDKMQNGTFSGTSSSGKPVQGLNKNGNIP